MKKLLILLLSAYIVNYANAQDSFVRQKYNDKLSFVRFDSLAQKQTTVVEYDKFLILCELPMITQSKTKGLEHETKNAQSFLKYLQKEYKKPVKYVISSHWHKHSLSGIVPFLENGAKIISTSYNWKKALKYGVLPKADSVKYTQQIIQVERDSLILAHTKYPIRLVVMDSTFHRKPTDDYLMPYFVKDKTLFVSCMGAIKDIDYKKVRCFTYSSRLLDILKLVEKKNLPVAQIIRLSFSKRCLPKVGAYVFPFEEIKDRVAKGKSPEETIAHLENINLEVLRVQQDSIFQDAVAQQMPSNLFRIAALNCLDKKEYEKAIIYAKMLNLYYSGVAFYLNTLGECYYRKGDMEMAKHYHREIRNLTDKYGIEEWKKNKEKAQQTLK